MKSPCAEPLLLKSYTASQQPVPADPRMQPVLLAGEVPDTMPEPLFLQADEQQRAARLLRPALRKTYQVQHHLLRQYLSGFLGVAPLSLDFETNPFGKPSLKTEKIRFSLSRSGNTMAFYFGPGEAGIDIEIIRDAGRYEGIARQHFHPSEQALIKNSLDFFTIWTRKEALLKAIGTGLTERLSAFDVSAGLVEAHSCLYTIDSYRLPEAVISLAVPAAQHKDPLCFLL
ncbi:MAG: 4'-phosphopantetheinyl transferase superfamily protein [Bacteroidia bacterium]|nr:4'-phosphopantetheinyl transferase superfamily protein [Bacteroidia bacterium]